MATFGSFADLRPAQVELAQRRQANTGDPLSNLIQGFQMPQQLANQALMSQVKTALAQQQLQDLQNPEAALQRKIQEAIAIKQATPQVVGKNIVGYNPTTKKYESLYAAPGDSQTDWKFDVNSGRAIGMVNGQLVSRLIPKEEMMGMAPSAPVSIPDISSITPTFDPALSALSSNLTMPTASPIVEAPEVLLDPPARFLGGTLDQRAKTAEEIRKDEQDFRLDLQKRAQAFTAEENRKQDAFLKGKSESSSLTPAQRISAQREVRSTYDELPAKLDFFGKGQVPGSETLKIRLDAVLKPVNNDFSKLNPQAANTFVFALNKLRDPTSATLLAEASQIADRAGIGDRFGAYLENIKSGNQISPQVAKDIYEVISQVHAAHKENIINSLIPIKEDMDELGKPLTSIGVPKYIQDEVENRINNPQSSQGVARVISTREEYDKLPPGSSYVGPDGIPAIKGR